MINTLENKQTTEYLKFPFNEGDEIKFGFAKYKIKRIDRKERVREHHNSILKENQKYEVDQIWLTRVDNGKLCYFNSHALINAKLIDHAY